MVTVRLTFWPVGVESTVVPSPLYWMAAVGTTTTPCSSSVMMETVALEPP